MRADAVSNDVGTWSWVARLSELVEGEPLAVKIGNTRIGLYLVDNQVHALWDICSHEFAYLTDGLVEGDKVECPLHQAQFSIRTGKALSPPAEADIPVYPVKVDGDDIYVHLRQK
jgi:nitrite reductase/ring-hydroxylating ferredoxin subunit